MWWKNDKKFVAVRKEITIDENLKEKIRIHEKKMKLEAGFLKEIKSKHTISVFWWNVYYC